MGTARKFRALVQCIFVHVVVAAEYSDGIGGSAARRVISPKRFVGVQGVAGTEHSL